MSSAVVFDFNKKSKVKDWVVVVDGVMGGKSTGTFELSNEGHGVFKGHISLENYGGFSSLRYSFPKIATKKYSKAIIKLKGDGKNYQFRVKANSKDYYSYIAPFSTTGDWEEIEIPLNEMYPSYRGRKLDQPNFSSDFIEQITFLIGNKKEESFKLLIDNLVLK